MIPLQPVPDSLSSLWSHNPNLGRLFLFPYSQFRWLWTPSEVILGQRPTTRFARCKALSREVGRLREDIDIPLLESNKGRLDLPICILLASSSRPGIPQVGLAALGRLGGLFWREVMALSPAVGEGQAQRAAATLSAVHPAAKSLKIQYCVQHPEHKRPILRPGEAGTSTLEAILRDFKSGPWRGKQASWSIIASCKAGCGSSLHL
jgi:hypothetical protein